ncbi:hypothetical protein V8E52_010480, partial [Russula decolorans]
KRRLNTTMQNVAANRKRLSSLKEFKLLSLSHMALAPPSSANAVSPDIPHHRDHVNLNRMIKKCAPHALLPRQCTSDQSGDNHPQAQAQAQAVGAAADPSTGGLSSPVPSSTPVASATSATQASETSQSPQPTSSPVSSALSSATPSVSSTSSQSSVSSTSSTTPTSTTSSLTPSTSSPLPTSSTPTPSSQVNKQQLPASNGQSTSVDSADSSQIGGSSLSHSAIMILVVIAASIGGCVIVWTIIRKWKLRPSSQFEDRLEPVDWQPADHDSGLPAHHTGPSNASSFHSAGHDSMMGLSRSDSGGAYNAARNLTPIPDHDFTTGPAAAVGGYAVTPRVTYADLARGPSPQPPMQEALQRGPSINRAYKTHQGGNGVPEAYDYNNTGPRCWANRL